MSTYVVADIHGCYREFMQLLDRVKFDDKKDDIYILGDVIDRGPGSQQIFEWVYARKDRNVHMCMGNHEALFCDFVEYQACKVKAEKLLRHYKFAWFDISQILTSDIDGDDKTLLLQYYNYLENGMDEIYDKYGTIEQLKANGISKRYLDKMKSFFEKLPYYFTIDMQGKTFYLVHAYITEPVDECSTHDMIWSRAYPNGKPGIPGKVVIYGHTPTITRYYNGAGGVKVDKHDDAVTVNIDCGCCWRTDNAKLALLRLDDLKVYYSNIYKYNFVPDI